MSAADLPQVRWLCWPNQAVTDNCVKGLCNHCDKPPHRRKQTYKDMLEWAGKEISLADVKQGMLFRPVRSTRTTRSK